MKILLTGFQPFDKDADNSSWQTVLAVRKPAGCELRKLELPVTFDGAFTRLKEEIDCFEPDVVLSLGQATGRVTVSVEFVGLNWRDATIPDNDGRQPVQEPIMPGCETAHLSSLPVYEMVAAMNDAGYPAYVSFSAGCYVCNEILYSTAHYRDSFAKTHAGASYRNGFIHLPLMREQAALHPRTAYMEVATMATAVEKGLEAIVKNS